MVEQASRPGAMTDNERKKNTFSIDLNHLTWINSTVIMAGCKNRVTTGATR
jgi:hypothetical protein